MVKFLLWCILLVLCWPLALLALVLYPLIWILMLPFRLAGIAVGGVFELLRAIITLPARILSGPRHGVPAGQVKPPAGFLVAATWRQGFVA